MLTDTTPSESSVSPPQVGVAQIAAALATLRSSTMNVALLSPRSDLNDDELYSASRGTGPIAWAASEFLAARVKFSQLLANAREESRRAVDALVWPYLSDLLGATLPGPLTLQVDGSHQSITEHIVGLEAISERDGVIAGMFTTASANGRSRDTRWFIVKNGRPLFQEHVNL